MFTTLSESILIIVAVIGLTILNIIFFMQRRDEFGILYAAGYGRTRLLVRTLRESVSVVSVAWLVGVAFCVAFMFYQANICALAGLRTNFVSLTPWLFTLPIPLAVVVVSVGTIAWALFRLDPVAVIERR